MSVPHPDAFSAGLLGAAADSEQQLAAQYFSIFMLPNSASVGNGFLFWTMGIATGFKSKAAFQKALWWYKGAFDAGVLARPPSVDAATLWNAGHSLMAGFRKICGGDPDEGVPQRRPTGIIVTPALYVCGALDRLILGNRAFAKRTADYCT